MKRILARLDIKNNTVIKGVHLEGLRKVGDPVGLAYKYYKDGIQEIYLNDAVASLYNRNNLFDVLDKTCQKVFVPICIGGGLRSLGDVEKALAVGADKVAINTGIIKNPQLVNEISRKYGSQCLVGVVEAKRIGQGWKCYYDCGREASDLDVVEWAKELEQRGVGELMVTSVDQEGTKKGFDLKLMTVLSETVRLPLIASGGCGTVEHIRSVLAIEGVRAAALASVLHYNLLPTEKCLEALHEQDIRT